MTDIIHKELCYTVNGLIFDVHNGVGPGVREECYQAAKQVRLSQAGLPFLAKPQTRRELVYLGEVADVFVPDLVVAERLIVELKVQPEGLTAANFRQTMAYLKFWQLPLGLLVNFATVEATIQRVLYEDQVCEPEEEYKYIDDLVTPQRRPLFEAVREALLGIHARFGLGYNDRTYRKMLEIDVRHRGLPCQSEIVVRPTFRNQPLPHSRISPLAIAGDILVEVEAVQDAITARAVRTMQTHLRMTGAALGLVVNFGKRNFQIRGIRPPAQRGG